VMSSIRKMVVSQTPLNGAAAYAKMLDGTDGSVIRKMWCL
jgi:hypothetical protein